MRNIQCHAIILALLCTSACYRSDYLPRRDGRARVLWKENTLVSDFSSSSISTACANQVREAIAKSRHGAAETNLPPEWHPTLFLEVIGAVSDYERAGDPQLAPSRKLPFPVFTPQLAQPDGFAAALLTDGRSSLQTPLKRGAVRTFRYVRITVLDPSAFFISFFLSPFIMPIHTLLSLFDTTLNPTSQFPHHVDEAIDFVNAYNELARLPGSDCSYQGSGRKRIAP